MRSRRSRGPRGGSITWEMSSAASSTANPVYAVEPESIDRDIEGLQQRVKEWATVKAAVRTADGRLEEKIGLEKVED